jgi:tetratricopeptide (TPR) repeat protein
MKLLLLTLLLQSPVTLPPRANLANPATGIEVPKQLKKDYDKLWTRFLLGKEDVKVSTEADKLLKKDKNFIPALMIQFYVHYYAGRTGEAERIIAGILERRPEDRFALKFLGDLAYSRNEHERVVELYGRLLALDPTQPELEARRHKAVTLAVETILRGAGRAAQEGRFADAERQQRHALRVAPDDGVLHGQLAVLLLRQRKSEEAIVEFRRQMELGGPVDAKRGIAEALMDLGRTDEAQAMLDQLNGPAPQVESSAPNVAELEDLGRWGNDLPRFREIGSSTTISREQLAWIVARYFPQIIDLRQSPQIVTDIEGSWATSEIQRVIAVGLLDPLPNHTFQPARTVTRGEFAQVVARLIRSLSLSLKDAPPITAPDLVPGSSLYRELQLVLDHGLLGLDDAGNFNVLAPLRGEEAVNAAEKLLRIIRDKAA